MKAIVINSDRTVTLHTTVCKPNRKKNEALVRVLMAGICNTDLELMKGYQEFEGIIGHEFVGMIQEIDMNERGLSVGTRVVGEINLACENCTVCDDGGIMKRNHCPKRTVLGIKNKSGTFAEYLTLPMDNLYAVPDDLQNNIAVFAEPLGAAFRIVEQIMTTESTKIAIIGDGKLGNLITQVMTTQPHSTITLFGKHQRKLDRIQQQQVEKLIVTDETARQYSCQFDICIEASGTPNGLLMASEITKCLGSIILKSTCATGSKEFNTAPFVVKEIKIIGSRCGNFPMAIKALQEQKVHVEGLIDHVFPLDKALEALEVAKVRGTMKVLIKM